jgi:hypothetical protein
LAISANNIGRIFRISGSVTVSLSGLTIRDGRVDKVNDYSGGGVYIVGSTLTLTNVELKNNFAKFTSVNPPLVIGYGGAIYAEDSSTGDKPTPNALGN